MFEMPTSTAQLEELRPKLQDDDKIMFNVAETYD